MKTLIEILVLAAIYGVYASGFTLVFGLFDVLNLAHAAVFAFGAIFTMFLVADHGMPLLAAAAVAIVACAVLGVLIERIAFRPIRYRGSTIWGRHIGPLITSLGVASILAGGERLWFGIDPRYFPSTALPSQNFSVSGSTVTVPNIVAVATMILVFGGLSALLRFTRWGLEVRGVAHGPATMPLFGINVERRIMEVFGLAAALGGIAGIVWGLSFNIASPVDTPGQVDIRGFAIIILGGMGSIPGALLGAIFLAASEVLSVQWLSSGWQELIAFAILFLMLLVRPQGILGSRVDERGD